MNTRLRLGLRTGLAGLIGRMSDVSMLCGVPRRSILRPSWGLPENNKTLGLEGTSLPFAIQYIGLRQGISLPPKYFKVLQRCGN